MDRKRSTAILSIIMDGIRNKKVDFPIWSIKVFHSGEVISNALHSNILGIPTLQASDVTDVHAEFIADPFIIGHNSRFYMFFEVLDKPSGKGIIGLAISDNGDSWGYDRIVLKENYHLSYPHVFRYEEELYMIPESSDAGRVLLYKAKNFPYEWEIVCELLDGDYIDSSVFQYNDKWWMFAGHERGTLHLFYADELEGKWVEHPQSPLLSDNFNITRPGGRVIVDQDQIYRYTQDGRPYYGSAVRAFRIHKLSDTDFQEEEVELVLCGTNRQKDWRKDGMHHIDQLKIADDSWLVAVDGHTFDKRNYLAWKIKCLMLRFLKVGMFATLGYGYSN